MTSFPFTGAMAWVPSEADPEMEFSMLHVYQGVCIGNKYLHVEGRGRKQGWLEGVVSQQRGPVTAAVDYTASGVGMSLQTTPCCADMARPSEPCTD